MPAAAARMISPGLPLVASEMVLISILQVWMAKPGLVVAMIEVAGGSFLKCESQTSLNPGTSSRSLR
jgi:hypothetical protein